MSHDDVIKWKHIFALLALCAGNSPVTGEFPSQRPVTRNFDVFFDLRLNKRLSKQSWGWWFETPSRSLWRHCDVIPHWQCYSEHTRTVWQSTCLIPNHGLRGCRKSSIIMRIRLKRPVIRCVSGETFHFNSSCTQWKWHDLGNLVENWSCDVHEFEDCGINHIAWLNNISQIGRGSLLNFRQFHGFWIKVHQTFAVLQLDIRVSRHLNTKATKRVYTGQI